MRNELIKGLVQALKILTKKEITIIDWKKREYVTLTDKIEVEETENSIFITTKQAIVSNGDIDNKIEPRFEADGITVDNYSFKLDKNKIEDWDIQGDVDIEFIGKSNTITVEFAEELLNEVEDTYITDLAAKDSVNVEEKIKQVYGGNNVNFKELTYKEMDYYYKNYYQNLYKNEENTNKLFQY